MARASSLQLTLESRLHDWQYRERQGVKRIEASGLFRRVDEALLSPDASFGPPSSAPLMPLVESRFLAQERENVGLILVDWRSAKLQDVPADRILKAAAERAIPASFAYLTDPDRLKRAIASARGRLIILPGTGLIDAKENFSFVVIDHAHAENDFENEDDEEVGPILRVMQTSLSSLRHLPSVLLYARPNKSQ